MLLTDCAIYLAVALFVSAGDDSVQKVQKGAERAGPNFIEKTIYVPQWVTETRTCKETRYRTEVQEKECVTYKCVQVTKQVPCERTVWVREKRNEVQTFEVDTPVVKWVDQKYHEYVPGTKTVTKYRTRTECRPVTVKKVVCEDQGHYEQREVETCDAKGVKSTRVCQVWVPKIVEREVEVTENQMVEIKEPYTCEVTVCVPVERTRRVKVWETKTETKTVNHPYETVVPKTRVEMVTVCVTEKVPATKVVPVEVCVPYTVDVEKQVRVCKMVPKTIRIPVCGN